MKTARVAFCAGLLVLFLEGAAHAQQYTITDLGTLGGDASYAASINNVGQIVGRAQTPNSEEHPFGEVRPFMWYGGVMREINGDFNAIPLRINDGGSIVGWSSVNKSAFIYQGGQYTNLGSLGGSVAQAEAVNASNQVVGGSEIFSGGPSHAFLWEGGVMRDLGTLGYDPAKTYSYAYDINDLGHITGDTDVFGDTHAFIWKDGVMSRLVLPGSYQDGAMAINNKNQVAGWMVTTEVSTQCEAFLWSNGVVQNLGTLPGHRKAFATDINDFGQVVGVSQPGYSEYQPFLWENGRMYNFNDLISANSGWNFGGKWSIAGINNRGEIAGCGINPEGKSHAFLLSPAIRNIPQEIQETMLIAPDGVFNGRHHISFVGDSLIINEKIRLTGVDPGEELKRTWENGIERIWSNQYDVVYGGNDYSIVMNVEFVDRDEDIVVEVIAGDYLDVNIVQWCTGKPAGWDFEFQDRVAAHEFGHMIGLYDEYYQDGRGTLDPDNPFTKDPTSIMRTPRGVPKERHYQGILEWLEGETEYDMVLAQSPLWRPGEPGALMNDGSPVPEPASIVLMIVGSMRFVLKRRDKKV